LEQHKFVINQRIEELKEQQIEFEKLLEIKRSKALSRPKRKPITKK